jgi:hypothetical protein
MDLREFPPIVDSLRWRTAPEIQLVANQDVSECPFAYCVLSHVPSRWPNNGLQADGGTAVNFCSAAQAKVGESAAPAAECGRSAATILQTCYPCIAETVRSAVIQYGQEEYYDYSTA